MTYEIYDQYYSEFIGSVQLLSDLMSVLEEKALTIVDEVEDLDNKVIKVYCV